MSVFLKLIELENFKSYSGKLVIGPLKSFTAVIGPNGSGKSNLMDAISFVMGEKSSSLRVKRLNELVYGWSIGKPLLNRAYVKAVFQLEDGTEKSFTRTVDGTTSEYCINDKPVPGATYSADLSILGIKVKAKNFLVFQGAIESVATKKPYDLTLLLEEISGSGGLKAEYDRLKTEMLQAEEEIQCSFLKKKGMAAERKEATIEIKEAEKYQRSKEKYAEKIVELQLFRLFHNEKMIEELEDERTINRQESKEIEKKKNSAEEALRSKKIVSARMNRELTKIELDMKEIEVTTAKKKPALIKAKEGVIYMRKKLEAARKSLSQARNDDQTHKRDVDELKDELGKIEETKAAYEASIAIEFQSQIADVTLEEQQIREYNRLKEESSKQTGAYIQLLDSANREMKSDQDRLENVLRRKTEIERELKRKRHMRDEIVKRIDKLEEHVIVIEDSLTNQTKLRDELRRDVVATRERIRDIQRELESVTTELGDASVDKHEIARINKKAEIVENFKQLFPGVYDRMYNMCEPIHKRYNVAVTKVFGIYMEAIVVDTVETARQCVQYLKEQYLEAETFLPLDYIQPRLLKERLRDVKEPANVRLLYDVLKFSPKKIDRAVLFATRNVLVCETPEDACRVAYDLDKATRHDCIALDGTCYQKAGLISGGNLDLARRAKRWDDKQMAQLKSRKENLTEELRDSLAKSRKESDLNTIESQIRGFETRFNYNKSDLVETRKEILALEAELKELRDELEKYEPTIANIEKTIAEKEREIEILQGNINNVEDKVYGDFCREIGVANIRQYEERELQSQQERAKKRMEFENQCNRIVNQLEFEKQRDTRSQIVRWEGALRDAEDNLKLAEKTEIDLKEEINADKIRTKQLESLRTLKKDEIYRNRESVDKWKREVGVVTKLMENMRKKFDTIETKIEQRLAERRAILTRCKMEDITIPMVDGTMEDITDDIDAINNNETNDSTQDHNENDVRIKINYGLLSNKLKDIDGRDVEITVENLMKVIHDLHKTFTKMRIPNMKAMQKLALAREKFQMTNAAFQVSRKKAKRIKSQFEKVKKERYDKFMPCFEHVSKQIDQVYKGLTKNQSAQAFLEAENSEESYLGGINYNCVAPGKRFQLISNLSGGEKTVAALALLFAIHSFNPAPFFVLDEIDASLDNTNVGKVASYIRERTDSLQIIVISLKEEFFSHADALIGINPEAGECLRSNVLTCDLTTYDE